jgi:hypothetical protein
MLIVIMIGSSLFTVLMLGRYVRVVNTCVSVYVCMMCDMYVCAYLYTDDILTHVCVHMGVYINAHTHAYDVIMNRLVTHDTTQQAYI